jgi:hypothetical protein
MPALLRDDILEKLERSRAYLIVDIVFNWIGGIGELLLVLFVFWTTWTHGPWPHWKQWMELVGLGIVLLCIRGIKDYVLAWAGFAPPDYSRWFGPKQIDVGSSNMRRIRDAQERAARIRERGIRLDEMLEENEAKFERHQRSDARD